MGLIGGVMRHSISVLLVSLLLLQGCAWLHKQTQTGYQPNTFEQNIPLVVAALNGASSAAAIAYIQESRPDGDFTICLVGASVRTVLSTAAEVIEKKGAVFPEVAIDFSGCLAPRGPGKSLESVINEEEIAKIVGDMLDSALALAEYYAGGIPNCVDNKMVISSAKWARGLLPVVIEEMTNPDGELTVPSVAVDLAPCAEKAAMPIGDHDMLGRTPTQEPEPEPPKESE